MRTGCDDCRYEEERTELSFFQPEFVVEEISDPGSVRASSQLRGPLYLFQEIALTMELDLMQMSLPRTEYTG